MHDVRHKKTLRGLRETLRISAKSNMGDEEDVSELARLEERHGSHLAAEKMRKGILAMLVVSATVLAGIGLNQIFRVGSKTNSFTTAAAGNGRIAYVSQSEDGSELWVVNADGSDPVRLVGPIGKLPASLSDPFWSSDGTKLGYNAHGIGSVGIETINADGAGRAVITPESLEYADSPDWSPDGQRIAFSYSDGRRGSSIFVMNPDGTNVSRLTGDDLSAQKPSWSPDGTKIAFVVEDLSDSDALNNWDVYVMNGDGSGVTRLTEDPHLDLDPDWSPDGTEIVFRSRRDSVGVAPGAELGSPPDEIYVMNADGTEPRRLTVDEAVDQHPVWSPDGTMIAFHSLRDGPDGIYVMNADGSGIHRVASGSMPAWQPVPSGDARVAETSTRPQSTPSDSPRESGVVPETAISKGESWSTHRDPFGWSMAYPRGWRLQTFHEETLATFRGALVSNVDFEFHHPDLGEGHYTTEWDMRGLPPHAVVVQVQYLVRMATTTTAPDSTFPLSLDRAERVQDKPPYGAPQPRLYLPLVVRGDSGYAVFAWFGPEASVRDRATAEQIVASITFVVAP
jgi:Tol biopolymer transport system component